MSSKCERGATETPVSVLLSLTLACWGQCTLDTCGYPHGNLMGLKAKAKEAFLYRSPNSKVAEYIREFSVCLDKLFDNKYKFKICGDMNINFLQDSKHEIYLTNLLLEYDINPNIRQRTRITN